SPPFWFKTARAEVGGLVIPSVMATASLVAITARTRSLSEQRKTTIRLLSPNILEHPTVILLRPKLPT
ncbi:MAG: hypothetical protein ACETWR_24920, partial [Anaerolineae bacterium]